MENSKRELYFYGLGATIHVQFVVCKTPRALVFGSISKLFFAFSSLVWKPLFDDRDRSEFCDRSNFINISNCPDINKFIV